MSSKNGGSGLMLEVRLDRLDRRLRRLLKSQLQLAKASCFGNNLELSCKTVLAASMKDARRLTSGSVVSQHCAQKAGAKGQVPGYPK